MGQGFSLTSPPAGSAGIDVPELGDLVYEKSIGSARFLKAIRARHHDGVVLVKVLTKPYTPMPLDEYRLKIVRDSRALADIPNALGYQRVFETETNGYLVRQYLYNSLYDRLSTRPFLEDVEKKWLAFQLLCALRDCHARDVYHGDIKTENTLVTSWNWLYLTDFSSAFKQVMLPDDNPGDFSYFFDTSGRRTCYLAPERFYAPGAAFDPQAKLTWAMDVFSAGCVIAELFTETPTFSLSQLYNYRSGKYDPAAAHLSRIADRDVRELVIHMIQLDPQRRYSAEDYLRFWRKKVFPDYFYDFLHQYMEVITDPSSGQYPVSGATRNLGEADDRIDRVFYDFDKISYSLGHRDQQSPRQQEPEARIQTSGPRLGLGHLPVRLNIPNNEHYVTGGLQPPADDGTLMFLTLVCSSLRNTARAASRIRACDVLLAFAERLTDEAKLDRVLPYLMTLLNDRSDVVVVTALKSIAQLLALVRVVTPVNAPVFGEYILPRMQVALLNASTPPSPLVRMTYASVLGTLAVTAARFLDMAGALRGANAASSLAATGGTTAGGDSADADVELGVGGPHGAAATTSGPAFEALFDDAQQDLVQMFESHTKMLIEDPDPYVRRAFLGSVPELCMFFGTADANDIILPHLNTYLNDRDWMLKCALFDTIAGIAALVGSTSLEEFILPLMVQALMDTEEFVVQGALHSLAELAGLGMLSKARVCELVDVAVRFTMHPNIWVREAAAEFVSASTRYLSAADVRCLVYPLVSPYLKPGIIPDFSESTLLDALKKPLTRAVFDQALVWALKSDRGVFWKPQQRPARNGSLSRVTTPASFNKLAKNDEDEQWLARLRNLGMTVEDEFKLLSLREFIWRLGQMRTRDASATNYEKQKDERLNQLNNVIALRTLGVNPQIVFFDEEQPQPQQRMLSGLVASAGEQPPENVATTPRTITDALRDASMTIDDPSARRRRAHHVRSRLDRRGNLSPISIDERRPLDAASLAGPPASNAHLLSLPPTSEPARSSSGNPTGRRPLRHQSSALGLLNRKDSVKSGAETGTTEANVLGQVGGSAGISAGAQTTSLRPDSDHDSLTTLVRPRVSHSYEGNDPSILQMLDAMFVDNYPHDVAEFGPMVSPMAPRRRGVAAAAAAGASIDGRRSSGNASAGGAGLADPGWRPSGRLVATFAEHIGAINRVVASPDHAFFVTGGDDGTVKVWDTARLERNIAHKARATYSHAPGSRVLALCFVQDTHCFVSCASDGSVHVVKVDVSTNHRYSSSVSTSAAAAAALGPGGGGANELPRYARPRLVREYRFSGAGEFAVWCEHFKQGSDGPSTLLLATNRSRVEAIDLRDMTPLYSLENPVQHGAPTSFCIDRRRNWLCLATSHGVLDLWDLRFKVRLRGWGVPGKGPIYRVAVHPAKGRGRWVCVAGGTGQGEVTVWDLEKMACREVYRVGGNRDGPRGYDAWEVDEDKPEGMLGLFATNLEPAPTAAGMASVGSGQGNGGDARGTATAASVAAAPAGGDRGVRAMAVGSNLVAAGDAGTTTSGVGSSRDVRNAYLLTAGSDKKLRFWDLARIEHSVVFSGLSVDEGRPSFTASHPTATMTLNTERLPRSSAVGGSSAGGGPAAAAAVTAQQQTGAEGGGRSKAGRTKAPRSTVISIQQQQLLRSHLDAVLDMCVLESPYTMTVSVDRSGVVFIFQ